MTGRKILIILLAAALLAAMAMPALAQAPTMRASPTPMPGTAGGQDNVMSALQSRPEFSKIVNNINKVGMQSTLSGDEPYTIFAPANDAFNNLHPAKAYTVNMDNANLGFTLKYHAVPGKYTDDQLKRMSYLMTVNGLILPVNMAGNQIMIDGARITGPGIVAGNSIIYPVDNVMVPPILAA